MRSLWLLLLALPLSAETFEVATVKPTSSDGGRPSIRIDNEQVNIRGVALRISLGQAYRVRPIWVFGEDWLDTKFDIAAKLPVGATVQQVPEMLQALLTERFGVRAHKETRPVPTYVLTVAKGGLKLKEVPADTPNGTRSVPGTMIQIGTLESIGAAASFAGLAFPLIDQTGLEGKYEIPLASALIFPSGARNEIDDSDAVSRMQQALEPLGLNIERKSLPSEVVVIDHIDHTPTGN